MKKSVKKAQKKLSPKKAPTKAAKPAMRPVAKNAPKKEFGVIPLLDRVLIKPFTEEALRQAEGEGHFGILLPESVTEEKSAQGTVIAVGQGRIVDGKRVSLSVSVGDVVLFSKYGYDEVTYKGEEFYLLKEDQILAILN
jgi:chaperonin GroES